ncbi:MAG: hypothetical protein HY699_13775 [Deltaproteobacteria bacterium]|nr:hypothetical protein [Deltaproteobacteria bacterium]
MQGQARLAQLSDTFPGLPRSILLKTELLRDGVQYTPEVEEAGGSSLPFFLLWNPVHADNPKADDERMMMVPWKFDLADGTPVKLVLEKTSPYTIRKSGAVQYVLCREGEEIEPIAFEPRPDWYMTALGDGQLLPTVIQLFSRSCLFGCILRYCEYSRTDEQCRYCSLDSTVDDFQRRGFEYSISAHPDHWAEGFRRALAHGPVRHVSLTGGSLRDTHKEAAHYSKILAPLKAVRDELGSAACFEACVSAMAEADQRRLKDAGLNVLAHHMDTWEARLWPEIVPAKSRYIGRDSCLAALERAVGIFGAGNVQSNFVVGVETVSDHGIRDAEEGLEAWRRCFATLLQKGVLPRTTVWQSTEGAAYHGRPKPPAEYFIRVGYERYRLIKEHRMHGQGHVYPCARCNSWSCDLDFMRLLDGCDCAQCA